MLERTLRVVPNGTAGETNERLAVVATFAEAAALLRGDIVATGQINHIRVNANRVAEHAKAQSTRTNYGYWWGRFERFCADPATRRHLDQVHVGFQVLPADPSVIVAFLTDLTTAPPDDDPDFEEWSPPSPGTLDNIVAAINHHHARANHTAPASVELTEYLKGAGRRFRRAVKRATPLRLATLEAIGGHLAAPTTDPRRLAARLVAVLYSDTMGLSDIANLSVGDLTVTADALCVSTRHGVVVYPVTGGVDDPIEAAAEHLAVHPNPAPDAPLITNTNGRRAGRQTIRATLHSLAKRTGTDWNTTEPLTPETRNRLVTAATDDPHAIRDHALFSLGYAAALRRSELVGLTENSLIWNRDRTALTIEMWITKTNHDGRYPDTVTIHTTGNPATCPITAVERLVDLRRRYGITDPALALFTGIHRTGRPATPALSGQSVTDILQSRVRDAIGGDVSGYTGHSMRRGFCTDAAHAGKSVLTIAAHTRHRSLDIVLRYIDDANRLDPALNPQAQIMKRIA